MSRTWLPSLSSKKIKQEESKHIQSSLIMFARTPPATMQTWSKTLEGLRNKVTVLYLPTLLTSLLLPCVGSWYQCFGWTWDHAHASLLQDSTVLPEHCECWAYGNESLLPLLETSFWLGYLANTDSTLNSVRIAFWQELIFWLHNSRLAVLLKQSTPHFSTHLTLPPLPPIWIFFPLSFMLAKIQSVWDTKGGVFRDISSHSSFSYSKWTKGQGKKKYL